MDVDASRSNKTAEVGAMRKMLDRTEERFGVKPDWIAADTAYGSSDNLDWLALKRQILPFIPGSACGVQDEFTRAATAQNLRKLAKLKPMEPATG